MLKNSHRKLLDIEYRLHMLDVIKYCLERYKETQNEELLEWAKTFGQYTQKLKEDIGKY